MMRVLRLGVGAAIALLVLGLTSGCGGEIDSEIVEVTQISAGRFVPVEGGPALVEPGGRIQCEPGVVFGVHYRIDVPTAGPGIVPVSFWWVHPEFAIPSKRLWGTETAARPSNPKLSRGESSLEGRALWTLDDPEERVDGEYRFEIRRVEDGVSILSVPFEVEGC